jgi:hypothetical protein
MGTHTSEWSWEVDTRHGFSAVKLAGVVTARDILSAQRDLAAHGRFDPSFGLVVDLSEVSDVSLTWSETRTIVACSPVALHSPRVIVAKTIVNVAMAHAFRAVREDITGTDVVRLCESMLEAREWLSARCPPATTM